MNRGYFAAQTMKRWFYPPNLFLGLFLCIVLPTGNVFGGSGTELLLIRTAEPGEGAFDLLVPDGWLLEGGIFRLDPSKAGGAGNAIAAKCDLSVKADREGSVMVRWLPDMLYMDLSDAPAAAFFPPGSNYNGMMVLNKISPEDFIVSILIPGVHPNAQELNIIGLHALDGLADIYRENSRVLAPQLTMDYAVAAVIIEYKETETVYREILVTVMEDYGTMGAGLWGNKDTFYFRAPAGTYDRWLPVLSTIHQSVQFDRQWLQREMRGQQHRAETMHHTLEQIQDIDRQISDHRRKVNAEIHNDMFLTLMEQEEYVNPFSGEVQTGTNRWRYRWVNEQGDVLYSDRESYDPNFDINLHANGFKKTPVRPRHGDR
jgi:hypothetical protein